MDKYILSLAVELGSEEYAVIAFNSLRVEKETKRNDIKKNLSVSGSTLHMKLEASDARDARIGINSFLDQLHLVVQTLEQFG
ncbi:hypothetical protein LSAT2_024377 [Lamellibrachia satsuma]|nr:hypothetical protein LSAT2_024377 [Lamellibrachia satsuma]